jgi:dTDP-4-dehydrorhamnose reductase
VIAFSSSEADFRQSDSVVAVVRSQAPDLIVNAAAYTAVDDAEREPDLAALINATTPGALACEAAHIGAALIHYSTDYVFDGSKRGAYVEDDAPAPLNEYGRSKLAGERAIGESGAVHLILRTSWIYAAAGKNFLLTVLRLAQKQRELRIVADQVGCPTSADVVADATRQIVATALSRMPGATISNALRPMSGTYHVVCDGSISWHGFATEIVAQAARSRLIESIPDVRAISTAEFPRPAQRPANSVLSTDKLRAAFGFVPPEWKAALEHVIAQIARENQRSSGTAAQ